MASNLSPLWISLKIAAIAPLLIFFLGIAAAHWMLTYRGKGKSLIEGVLISPLILPPTVVGCLLNSLTGCKNVSHAVMKGSNRVEALNWKCILQTLEPVPEKLTQVGVRAQSRGGRGDRGDEVAEFKVPLSILLRYITQVI